MSDQTTPPTADDGAATPEQGGAMPVQPAHTPAGMSPVEEAIEDNTAAPEQATEAPTEEVTSPATPETPPVEPADAATPAETATAEPEAVIQGAPERAGDKVDTTPAAQPVLPETPAATQPTAPTAEPASPQPGVVTSPSDLPVTGKRPDGLALDKGEKLIAAMGYIGILALIPLLLRRDSAFCRHHGPQALVVFVILMLAEIIGRLFGFVLPWFHAFTIIVMLVAWIVGFALAFQGQWFRIPSLFEWSRQLNLFAKEASAEERMVNKNED